MGPTPRLSVIVPSRDEGRRLAATVRAVRRTTRTPHELIVVDDGSRPAVRASDVPGCRLVRTRGEGPGAARNRGASIACAPILAFLDADAIPDFGTLDTLHARATEGRPACYAPVVATATDPAVRGWGLTLTSPRFDVRWLGPPASPVADVPVAGGVCLVLRRTAFHGLGGFAAFPARTMEDTEFSLRAWRHGVAMRVVPGAEVIHCFRPAPWSVGQRRRYLRAALATAARHLGPRALRRTLLAFEGWRADACALAEVRRARPRESERLGAWFDAYCARFGIAW